MLMRKKENDMPKNGMGEVKTVTFDDAGLYALPGALAMGQDLLLMDDIHLNAGVGKPMQLGFLFVALCTSGEADFTLGSRKWKLREGELLISLGRQVWVEGEASPDFHGKALLLSSSYAQDCVTGLNHLWPYLLYVVEHPVVKLTEKEQQWVADCYKLLRGRLEKEAGRFLRETVVSLTRAFYFELCNLLEKRSPEQSDEAKTRGYAIFDRFMRLLSQNYKTERSVEWYSSALCLTPKHLSEMVKTVSGRTAGQWITTLVMIEIKSLLQETNLSIKEIAQEMNFPNQSFLGKYFKNAEGISPSEFRHGL